MILREGENEIKGLVYTGYGTGETQYNEIHGTMKFCLLYQISC